MQAVLFDLDGTLLDIDIDEFLPRYFDALRLGTAELTGRFDVIAAVAASTRAMMAEHPGQTNRDRFRADFLRRTGVDIEESRAVFDRFYRDMFPRLGNGATPAKGGGAALSAARSLGLRVACATNPIFPLEAVLHRLSWASLSPRDFDAITSYENMHSCKPSAAYYVETAALLGVSPEACLMVGDDPVLDMGAADAGMATFFVGTGPARADYRGNLDDLAVLLPDLARG